MWFGKFVNVHWYPMGALCTWNKAHFPVKWKCVNNKNPRELWNDDGRVTVMFVRYSVRCVSEWRLRVEWDIQLC